MLVVYAHQNIKLRPFGFAGNSIREYVRVYIYTGIYKGGYIYTGIYHVRVYIIRVYISIYITYGNIYIRVYIREGDVGGSGNRVDFPYDKHQTGPGATRLVNQKKIHRPGNPECGALNGVTVGGHVINKTLRWPWPRPGTGAVASLPRTRGPLSQVEGSDQRWRRAVSGGGKLS